MKTLTYELDANGFVQPTAMLTLRSGREHYLGNPMGELKDAMSEGEPFVCHAVRGMAPYEVVVNPAHVASIEAQDR
jgi:hypothetical protein